MTVKEQLKKIIIEELNLEEISPEDIEDDAPLFGEGLGLDSLDAVEIVVLLEKHFGVEVKSLDEGREAFRSINALAAYIEERSPNESNIFRCHNRYGLYMRSRKYPRGMYGILFSGNEKTLRHRYGLPQPQHYLSGL